MSGRQWLLSGLILAGTIGLIVVRFAPKNSQTKPVSRSDHAAGYINSTACAGCHREIWDRFARTGMGRSMRPASASVMPPGFAGRHTFYHQPSDRHYTLLERDGKFYQRRHQTGPG